MSKTVENGRPVKTTPPIVSPEAWETARQQMLEKEKNSDSCARRPSRRAPADAMDGRRKGVRIRGTKGQG
jgi:predicted dithiol-disulfide oxidoreductase (DUF899 family)